MSDATIDELTEEIAKRRRAVARLEELEAELHSLEHAREILKAKREAKVLPASPIEIPLRKMTQTQAMIALARLQGGLLRVQPVKRILLQAGKIANPKNATNIMYTLIRRSDAFDHVSAGVYRLKDYDPNINGQDAPSA